MKKDSNVDRLYSALRARAANFEFKPDARINESVLSKELGASRTPLREALNRLVAEGFLTFQNGRGFFCRPLTPVLISDLYEARIAVELEATRLACTRASDAALNALAYQLEAQDHNGDAAALLLQDEHFHLAVTRLADNSELLRMLENLNDRVRYVRLIYLRTKDGSSVHAPQAHMAVLRALQARDADAASTAMRAHIEKRREDAAEAVRIAYSQIYVPDEGSPRKALG